MSLKKLWKPLLVIAIVLGAMIGGVDGSSKVNAKTVGKSEVYVNATNSKPNRNGTEKNPYKTFGEAIKQVADGGTIYIAGTYKVPKDFKWGSHGKTFSVKAKGEGALDFSAVSGDLQIGDAVIFDGITLGFKNGQNVFANGNPVVIGENVAFGNDAYININGGKNGTKEKPVTVESTSLVLLAGNYSRINGAGSYCNVKNSTHVFVAGTVNAEKCKINGGNAVAENDTTIGSTYVYVGGNANQNVSFTEGTNAAIIYGAGQQGTIEGDTHVYVAGDAKVNKVYGGGSATTVKGNTYVRVNVTDYFFESFLKAAEKNGTDVQKCINDCKNDDLTKEVNKGLSYGKMEKQRNGESTGEYYKRLKEGIPFTHNFKGAYLFGGGYEDIIEKNTYVEVMGKANFNAVYGGTCAESKSGNSTVKGNTYVTVGGKFNQTLSFNDRKNEEYPLNYRKFSYIFGGAHRGTVVGDTRVVVTDYARVSCVYGGGAEKTSSCGNTKVVVNGNVNLYDTPYDDTSNITDNRKLKKKDDAEVPKFDVTDGGKHGKKVLVCGGSWNGQTQKTNVTIGGKARFIWIFGGGLNATSKTNGDTSVKFGDQAVAYGIYGGSAKGSYKNTKVEMTGGRVAQAFGGGESWGTNKNTELQLLGGEIWRRYAGGCYNGSDKKHVDGIVSLTIGSGVRFTHKETLNNNSSVGSLNYSGEKTELYVIDSAGNKEKLPEQSYIVHEYGLRSTVENKNIKKGEQAVILIDDCNEITSEITIGANRNIRLIGVGGAKLYRSYNSFRAVEMFKVEKGAALTIQGLSEENPFVIDGRTQKDAKANKTERGKNKGSLISNYGNVTLENVKVQWVEKTSGAGGVISNNGNGTNAEAEVTIGNCVFARNASQSDGGVIYNRAKLVVKNSKFNHNISREGSGGAIYSDENASIKIAGNASEKAVMLENKAKCGGAIAIDKNSTVYLSGYTFEKNIAEGENSAGGAIQLNNAAGITATVDKCKFIENGGSKKGGAIHATCKEENKETELKIVNCLFKDNYLTDTENIKNNTGGGAIFTDRGVKMIFGGNGPEKLFQNNMRNKGIGNETEGYGYCVAIHVGGSLEGKSRYSFEGIPGRAADTICYALY